MGLGKTKITERELDMAFTLIDLLPEAVRSRGVQGSLSRGAEAAHRCQARGQEVVKSPAAREAKVIDLADALRRSVEAAKKGKPKQRAARPRSAPGGTPRHAQGRAERRSWRAPRQPVGDPVSGDVSATLKQLDAAKARAALQVDGHEVPVTNLDKPLWPGAGRRKPSPSGCCCSYLARVSPWMLPHLADRPLFVTRFPNGIEGKSFYQKHWDDPPPFARTVSIYSSQGDTDGDYLICENLPTLLWLGQMGSLEMHAWYSRTDPSPDATGRGRRFTGSEKALDESVLNYPDFVVFDLDPYDYSGRESPRRGAGAASSRVQPHPQAGAPGPGACSSDSGCRPG